MRQRALPLYNRDDLGSPSGGIPYGYKREVQDAEPASQR